MSDAKTIDQLPVFTGDLSSAYTLVRSGGKTYKAPVLAVSAASPGGTVIGGLPVAVTDAQPGETLEVVSGQWVNTHKNNLTDGGSF